ncbi:hypothetical protein ACFOLK_18780 [Marinococcus halophilus]|uniref:hypothetical protein n=1 Tax=Marinococcus halophilus TaxID=1371 RepID=UPI00361386C2
MIVMASWWPHLDDRDEITPQEKFFIAARWWLGCIVNDDCTLERLHFLFFAFVHGNSTSGGRPGKTIKVDGHVGPLDHGLFDDFGGDGLLFRF